jgi:hypothetical protein
MAFEGREQFRVLRLDKRNHLIADEIHQQGTIDHTPVYVREVVRRAIELGASAIVIAHNHPSSEPQHGTATIAREPFLKAVAAATAFTQAAGDNRAALRFAFAGDAPTISAAFDACGSTCHGSATITVNIVASTMADPFRRGLLQRRCNADAS